MSIDPLTQIRVVLVNTSHPGNIGSAARAMKTMGLSNLVLVEPRQFPNSEATALASGAADLLARAKVVSSLAEAVADCQLVIGTSARQRRIPWPLIEPRECGQLLVKEARQQQVALVFGRENSGLTNDELQQCHFHVSIPSNDEYGVLNVAMAVQVLCYEVRMAWLATQQADSALEEAPTMPMNLQGWDEPPVTMQEMELFFEHFEQTLLDMEFFDPDNPRQLLTRVRRLFSRTRPDKLEMNLLRGVLSSAQKWVKRAKDV